MGKLHYCDNPACRAIVEGDSPEHGQVMYVTVNVDIKDGLLGATDPRANHELIFCSASCAADYINKFVKIEKHWLETWKNGKILGAKKIVPKALL